MGNAKEEELRYPARIRQAANTPAVAPGKSTPLEGPMAPAQTGARQNGLYQGPSVFKTGFPLADQGLGCKPENTPSEGCFLAPDQRSTIMDIYSHRLSSAQNVYIDALTQLGVEEIIKKEPEHEDLFFELMLDVVGVLGGKIALRVFQWLKGGAAVTADVASKVTLPPGELTTHLHGEAPEHVKEAITSGVALGKSAAKQALKKDPTLSQEQTANLSYLAMLKDRATIVFQHLYEQVPVGLSDSLFLVLVDSYDSTKGHVATAYKEELAKKLDRFKRAGVGKIGKVDAPKFDIMDGAAGYNPWDGEETRAYWVNTPMGRRLGLYKRQYHEPGKVMGEDGERERTPAEMVEFHRKDLERSPYVFAGYVPEEFVDAAVEIHTAKWGAPPLQHTAGVHETLQMGDNR